MKAGVLSSQRMQEMCNLYFHLLVAFGGSITDGVFCCCFFFFFGFEFELLSACVRSLLVNSGDVWARGVFHTFPTYSGLAFDLTDTDCWASVLEGDAG